MNSNCLTIWHRAELKTGILNKTVLPRELLSLHFTQARRELQPRDTTIKVPIEVVENFLKGLRLGLVQEERKDSHQEMLIITMNLTRLASQIIQITIALTKEDKQLILKSLLSKTLMRSLRLMTDARDLFQLAVEIIKIY